MKRASFRWCVSIGVMTAALLSFGTVQAQTAEDNPDRVEEGKVVFEANCARCHGADGAGTNFGRPLTDIAVQQPDRNVHITSVTDGLRNMPALGGDLSEEEIDDAISYVRLTFVSEIAAEEEEPEELAATGGGEEYASAVGLSLIGVGGLLVLASRRRRAA